MYWAIVLGGAMVIGLGAAILSIGRRPSSPVCNGPWRHNPLVGHTTANAFLRARMAWLAPLAMNREEAIYFFAWTDNDGNALDSRNDYRLSGTDYDSLWWSITAQGSDGYLIPNDRHRYSYTRATVQRNEGGSFSIALSAAEREGNWLPTGTGRFVLMLRFYQPTKQLRQNLTSIPLPAIIQLTKE